MSCGGGWRNQQIRIRLTWENEWILETHKQINININKKYGRNTKMKKNPYIKPICNGREKTVF